MNTVLEKEGFVICEGVYSQEEISSIQALVNIVDTQNNNYRFNKDLFAIRNVLNELPALKTLILSGTLKKTLSSFFDKEYFCVKSVFFDKPPLSNWLVNWHQDMMINVNEKKETDGFGPWTVKEGLYSVLPPVEYLRSILTVRIHLDDTNEQNGAVRVIPGTHHHIFKIDEVRKISGGNKATTCYVKTGGIMLMKPLLLHSSSKSTGKLRRRVIHLEFTDRELPSGLQWRERIEII
jgi:ectoine hydroxylase-related dioxygenase (phytanoyl-CoA dioxygenase family)